MYSKSKIDKCVKLIEELDPVQQKRIEAENIFSYWRQAHIEPLTEITIKLQEWFVALYDGDIYISQRIKRKPQILRKLRRFTTRLTQLQDIGGCRIIVTNDSEVDKIQRIIEEKNKRSHYFEIIHYSDYRAKGRDDSGYRALHIIVKRKNVFIEIQVRSRVQHYWAESIERTSVISGRRLKELDGPEDVLSYFKFLSNVLYEIENGNGLKTEDRDKLFSLRHEAEEKIRSLDTYQVLDHHVNENFIQSMIGKEKTLRKSKINNWMIVFDWKKGQFLYWTNIDRNPTNAIITYSEYEEQWPEKDGFEVVLISSSSVTTIQETHSHYFGIETYDQILDTIDEAKNRIIKKNELDNDSLYILEKFYTHKLLGTRKANLETLKNHYCQKVDNLDKELTLLISNDFIIKDHGKTLYRLNHDKINEIKKLIGHN